MLRKAKYIGDYPDVSCDKDSKFANISVGKLLEYILNRIYVNELSKPICKKVDFQKTF